MGRVIYTVGTSNRAIEQFIDLLKKYKHRGRDVRSFPTSRFEHFKKEVMSGYLKEAGIEYIHLKELGGYRKRGYKSYIKTSEFEEGLKKLEEIADDRTAAIVCAEKPWRCHRRYITDELSKKGWEIKHIIDERESEKPAWRLRPIYQSSHWYLVSWPDWNSSISFSSSNTLYTMGHREQSTRTVFSLKM